MRSRCRYCQRTLGLKARVSYCTLCYWARRCQACGAPWSTPHKLGWCDECKDYLHVRRTLQREFPPVRPPRDERAARIERYRQRAEKGLDLFSEE